MLKEGISGNKSESKLGGTLFTNILNHSYLDRLHTGEKDNIDITEVTATGACSRGGGASPGVLAASVNSPTHRERVGGGFFGRRFCPLKKQQATACSLFAESRKRWGGVSSHR